MKNKRKIIGVSLSLLLFLAIGLIVFGLVYTSDSKFRPSNGFYESKDGTILEYSAPTSNSINITDLVVDINSKNVEYNDTPINEGMTINISTAKELYAFSILCSTTEAFLGYDYKLLNNIDYRGSSYAFIPVGWNNIPFTGSFNGDGYEIYNLTLDTINIDPAKPDPYLGMKYFAMFSELGSGALVTNLGLRDTNISINGKHKTLDGVAPLVGLIGVGAEVSFCFATDLRDPIIDEGGILAINGNDTYHISGLVYQNDGSFHDSYTAYNIIVNYTVHDYLDFAEILSFNHGTTTNLYFYNASIKSYTEANGSFKIVYKEPVGKTFNYSEHFGTYSASLDELSSSLCNSNEGWYSKESYLPSLNSYLDFLITPITRGLDLVMEGNKYLFTIKNERDYSYMYELMNNNRIFASSDMIYEIINDLDFKRLGKESYYYPLSISATIRGREGAGGVTLTNGEENTYPTLSNFSMDNVVTAEGVDARGLIPVLSGSLENLNLVLDTQITIDKRSNNINAIGAAVGFLNGGTIKNVNTSANFIISNNVGKYFVGGLVGLGSSAGGISFSTATGSIINNNLVSLSLNNTVGYMEGNAVGGAVGYISDTLGSLNDILSEVDIEINSTINNSLAVGGILGAGYTKDFTRIENRGQIVLNNTSSNNYKELYIAGIIGRLLGVDRKLDYLNNQGNITVILNNNKSVISGILNADLQVNYDDNNLTPSILKSKGRRAFYLSAASNSGTINVLNKANNLTYTYGVNIMAGNGFDSELSNISNLGYLTETKSKLNPIEIDMSIISEFAPVINVNRDKARASSVIIESIYNLRDINFITSADITDTNLIYSGIARGSNIDYYDISNEGNLTFSFTHGSGSGNLYISGLFNTLDMNRRAKNLFNGGDIKISESSNRAINLNIYVSGITYMNDSVIDDLHYNPLDNSFNSKLSGSIDSAINNGEINITSTKLNDNQIVNVPVSSVNLKGNIYASGIASINKGIISNTFNLGNIFVGLSTNSNINASGITYTNSGNYAQIRDSANNGIIKAINITSTGAMVNASGITSRLDIERDSYKQVIAFTINYGEIYAFSGRKNPKERSNSALTKAGGILASGICNIVNTVNYGNVFSTEAAGGMIGVISLTDSNVSNTNKAVVANTLNYANVKAINRFLTVFGESKFAKYSDIKNITNDSEYIDYGFVIDPKNQSIGALIGIMDYANKNAISIRYLINFFENVPIIGYELPSSIPTNLTLEDKKKSSETLINVSPSSLFLGVAVTYAPLSTVEDSDGNIGVFSSKFIFRKAMNGEIDPSYVTDKYIGDFFQFVAFEKVNDVILTNIGWNQIAYLDASKVLARDLNALIKVMNLNRTTADSLLNEALNNPMWLDRCDPTILKNILNEAVNKNITNEELNTILEYVLFDTANAGVIGKEFRLELVELVTGYIEANNQGIDYFNVLNTLLYDELLAKVIANDTPEYKEIKDLINTIIKDNENLPALMDAYMDALRNDLHIIDPLFNGNSHYYFEAKLKLLEQLLTGYSEAELLKILDSVSASSGNSSELSKYLKFLESNRILPDGSDAYTTIYNLLILNNSFDDVTFNKALNEAFIKYNVLDIVTKNISDDMLNRMTTAINNEASSIGSFNNITSLNLNNLQVRNYVSLWNSIKGNPVIKAYLNSSLGLVSSVNEETGKGIYAKATEFNNSYQSNDSPSGITNKGRQSVKIDGVNYNLTIYEGRVRTKEASKAIDTRYMFTPDHLVSEYTSFYGPFKDASFNVWNPFDIQGYNKGFDLYSTGEDIKTSFRYVPFFATTNEDILKEKGVLSSMYYPFLWNDVSPVNDGQGGNSYSQWVSPHIIDKQPNDGHNYLIYDYRKLPTIDNGYNFYPELDSQNRIITRTSEYEVNNAPVVKTIPRGTISYEAYNEVSEKYETKTYNVQSPVNLRLATNNDQANNYTDHAFRDYYLKTYITADIITGIWYQQNIWEHDSKLQGAYLTSKEFDHVKGAGDDSNNGYRGVVTTSYINYFIDDLIKLDGVKTKGLAKGRGIVDADEEAIINALMTKILSEPLGKEAVLKAISSNAANGVNSKLEADVLLEALRGTEFVDSFVDSVIINEEYINGIMVGNETVHEYMKNLIKDASFDTIDAIISIVINNQEAFTNILLSSYERAKKAVLYDYPIVTGGLNDFIYEYVSKLLLDNPNMSDADISSILNSANLGSLDIMKDIINNEKRVTTNSFDIYTLNGLWYYDENKVNSGTISYNSAIKAKGSSSTITFNSGNAYKLKITHNGSVSLNGDNRTSNGIKTDEFNLNSNTAYTISLADGALIYGLEIVDQSLATTVPIFDVKKNGQGASLGDTSQQILLNNSTDNFLQIDLSNLPANTTASISFNAENLTANRTNVVVLDSSGNEKVRRRLGDSATADITTASDLGALVYRIKINNNTNNERKVNITSLNLTITGTFNDITMSYTEDLYTRTAKATISGNNNQSFRYQIGANPIVDSKVSGTGTRINNINAEFKLYNSSTTTSDLSTLERSYEEALEAKLNTSYNSLPDVSKYILDKVFIKLDSSLRSITTTKPSYLIVEANGTGNISINNITKSVNSNKFYVFYLDRNATYSLSYGNRVNIVSLRLLNEDTRLISSDSNLSVSLNNKNTSILDFNYTDISGFDINTVIPDSLIIDGKTRYQTFVEVYPNIRKTDTKDANRLLMDDYNELFMTLFPTYKNMNQYEVFKNKAIFDNQSLKSLTILIGKADNDTLDSALNKLIEGFVLNSSNTNQIKSLFKLIVENNNESLILANKKLLEISNNTNKSDILDLFKAAYLGNNYLKSQDNNTVIDSHLKSILSSLPEYDFILGNRSIDIAKFKALANRVQFNLSTEGYGVFALSSSAGILNGAFIPDNVSLESLDKLYSYNSNLDYFILSDIRSDDWRGDRVGDSYPVDSVNHKVLDLMKQLNKSISTTIFRLDLTDSNNYTHRSSQSLIDLENKTITYFIPLGYINRLGNYNLTISDSDIANKARLEILKDIKINEANRDSIRIYAEAQDVYADYTIIFKEIDVSFDILYNDGLANIDIPATGGNALINLTSPSASGGTSKLPINMDLSLYIYLKNSEGIRVDESLYSFSTLSDNNAIVDSKGKASIDINIKEELPGGSYQIVFDILGTEKSLGFLKESSSNSSLTSFIYDGVSLLGGFTETAPNKYQIETRIDFGRAYSYNELTNPLDLGFYLNELKASTGASINISATKSTDSANLLTYNVVFRVTAEDGSISEYTHILKEKDPFVNYARPDEPYPYATLYKDGIGSTYIYNGVDDVIMESFERGVEPEYRIKYSLGNFYLKGNHEFTLLESNPGAVVGDSYQGFSVTITDSNDAGLYVYTYSYKSSGDWNGVEYIREYIFPELRITKNYSTNALINKISFLDSYEKLQDLATVMNPNHAIRPGNNVDLNEEKYQDMVYDKSYVQKISTSGKSINYAPTGTDYSSASHFFTVGTISNATLYQYSPTFKIESHAEIYQYTTIKKLTGYGLNKQSEADDVVLRNEDTLLIYVPYNGSDGSVRVFLIEVINGSWGKVYPDTFRGEGAEIATLTENKGSFSVDGIDYTISAEAGKPSKDNASLYMDYIGTPLDDHFWYVSYVVFSEDYLNSNGANNNLRHYHVALIDTTNKIYFEVELLAPADFTLQSVFITLLYNRYEENKPDRLTNQISGYVMDTGVLVDGMKQYNLKYKLQVLPTGYFYFYSDLPGGYKVEYEITNGKINTNTGDNLNVNEPDAYLPPSSIVTQTIKLRLIVGEDNEAVGGKWGASTSEIFTRKATLLHANA